MEMTNSINKTIRLQPIGRRLVLGQDIVDIQTAYELTLLDTTYLMGNYGGRFHKLIDPNDGLSYPLNSVPRCLMIRIITDWAAEGRNFPARNDVFGSALLIPRAPDPVEVIRVIMGHEETIKEQWEGFTEDHVGLMLGISGSGSPDRWIKDDSRPQPIVQRLMVYLVADIRTRGKKAVLEHMQRMELEAIARKHLGISDLLQSFRWNNVKDVKQIQTRYLTNAAAKKDSR